MKNTDLSPKTIETLAASLKEFIVNLRNEQGQIEIKIKEAEAGLEALGITPDSTSKKTRRRKWGQNRQEVLAFLNSHPDTGFTSDQIATQLNIPRTSNLTTLKRLKDDNLAECDINGLWTKKSNV